MSLVKDTLENLRSSVESLATVPTYTGRLDNVSNDKDAHLSLNDSNPWIIAEKIRQFNVLIQFRFKLDGINPGTPYFEDDAQGEVFDWIISLISDPIVGVTLTHSKTQWDYDEQNRYIGAVLFEAMFSGITFCD